MWFQGRRLWKQWEAGGSLFALGVWAATIAIFWCVCVYHIYTTRYALVYVLVLLFIGAPGVFCVLFYVLFITTWMLFECQWPVSRGVGELRLASHPTV